MDDVEVPQFYVVNRALPHEEAEAVMRVLNITPCVTAIVSDLLDTTLAFSLAPDVMRAASDESALELAALISRDIGRPVLVIGKADFLDAVYANGKREVVAKHA